MVVKKYSNRRLYDSEASRYVTLGEVAEKIRRGRNVRIVDAPSDEDITQPVLAQIILEGRGASRMLPVPLLYELVRMEDDALTEFFGRYLTWALQVYQRVKQGAQAVAPYAPFAQAPVAATEALARILGQGLSWGGEAAPPPPPASQAAPPPPPASQGAASEGAASEGAATEGAASEGAPGTGEHAPREPSASAEPGEPEPPASREELEALRREIRSLKRMLRPEAEGDGATQERDE